MIVKIRNENIHFHNNFTKQKKYKKNQTDISAYGS